MIEIRQKKRKKYTTLYLDINVDGYRVWEPLKLYLTGNPKADKLVMEQAELIRAKRMIEISSGEYGIDRISMNKDFLEFYKKAVEENPDYERRSSIYKHLCSYMKREVIPRLLFKDITETFWDNFRKYLEVDLKHKKSTLRTDLAVLKAVINLAVKRKVIKKNPLADVTLKRVKSFRTYLTWEELAKMKSVDVPYANIKNAFFFACHAGLRLGDIRDLLRRHFWDDKIALPSMEKTDKPVYVDFDEKIFEYIPGFDDLKPDEKVFRLPSTSTISVTMRNWTAAAGITKHVTFHTSRHTHATGILTYGGDIMTASKQLGHNDVRVTQIYADVVDQKKKQAVRNLPRIEKA